MQYLFSVIDEAESMEANPAGSGTPEEHAAIDEFNSQLQAQGYWVFAGGLGAPSMATTVDNRADAAVITDGPFVESKEYLAGFWILDLPDLDVALKLATDGFEGLQPEDRGSAVPVTASPGGDHPGPPARSGRGWSPPWPGGSEISTSPRRRRPRRSRPPSSGGRSTGCRPTPVAG